MAEIVDLQRELALIRGFSPLRRILLATPGTLQTALSAFFGAKVSVKVRDQEERSETVLRKADLVCVELGLDVGFASTEAQITDPDVRRLVLARELGVGQITALLGAGASFRLDEVGEEGDDFWRSYRLWGDGFSYRIRERFPGALYPDRTPPLNCLSKSR